MNEMRFRTLVLVALATAVAPLNGWAALATVVAIVALFVGSDIRRVRREEQARLRLYWNELHDAALHGAPMRHARRHPSTSHLGLRPR
jgi:hypothetical protein